MKPYMKHLLICFYINRIVTCDKTAPTKGFVHDGLATKQDMQYSSSLSTVSATWGGYADPESAIASYSVTIKRKHMVQGQS